MLKSKLLLQNLSYLLLFFLVLIAAMFASRSYLHIYISKDTYYTYIYIFIYRGESLVIQFPISPFACYHLSFVAVFTLSMETNTHTLERGRGEFSIKWRMPKRGVMREAAGLLEELQGYLLLAICFDLIQFEQHRRQRARNFCHFQRRILPKRGKGG